MITIPPLIPFGINSRLNNISYAVPMEEVIDSSLGSLIKDANDPTVAHGHGQSAVSHDKGVISSLRHFWSAACPILKPKS